MWTSFVWLTISTSDRNLQIQLKAEIPCLGEGLLASEGGHCYVKVIYLRHFLRSPK
jgi:hypothetical protein